MWRALKAKASVTRRRGLTTQTEMSLATAWIVQGYHTVLIWVVACSTDVVRPLQSTGRRSCTCDGQRTSPCRLSGVGEHWNQRRAGSRRLDKQVRGRSGTGIPRRQSLNRHTGSQWSCRSIGVMWSRRRALVIIRAAAIIPLYSNTVIGTLPVDWWAVTFGTTRRGLSEAVARPGPSSLYQM